MIKQSGGLGRLWRCDTCRVRAPWGKGWRHIGTEVGLLWCFCSPSCCEAWDGESPHPVNRLCSLGEHYTDDDVMCWCGPTVSSGVTVHNEA